MNRTLTSIGALLGFVSTAAAVECPDINIPCKVLYLTPQEEQALLAPGGIFETAEKGAYLALSGATQFLRKKISEAKPGELRRTDPPVVVKPPEAVKPPPPVSGAAPGGLE